MTLDETPQSVTACNCTICRRYGVLWAYGYLGQSIRTTGDPAGYRRRDGGDSVFRFCGTCGCVMSHIATAPDEQGRHWAAVNLRMTDPGPIGGLPVRHFDGHDAWAELPRDGRTVRDLGF